VLPRLGSAARPPLALALVAAVLAVSACGQVEGDSQRGQELFVQKCGACHTLANAGTKGVIGPNLDLAFIESLRDGLRRSTVASVVAKQIDLPQGSEMPADLVTGKDAEAVATYVAQAVGKKGGSAGGGPSGTARANAQNVLDIPTDPTGQLAYKFKTAQAKPGKVTLESKNDATVPHNIALQGGPAGPVISGGEVSKITTNLKAGSYTFYCSVPGHEQAGMKGTLTVK
jgi:mono/diheme cytochrome c family protein